MNKLYDLFEKETPNNRKGNKIRPTFLEKTSFLGLKDAIKSLPEALKRRVVEPTNVNDKSSRSHVVVSFVSD